MDLHARARQGLVLKSIVSSYLLNFSKFEKVLAFRCQARRLKHVVSCVISNREERARAFLVEECFAVLHHRSPLHVLRIQASGQRFKLPFVAVRVHEVVIKRTERPVARLVEFFPRLQLFFQALRHTTQTFLLVPSQRRRRLLGRMHRLSHTYRCATPLRVRAKNLALHLIILVLLAREDLQKSRSFLTVFLFV